MFGTIEQRYVFSPDEFRHYLVTGDQSGDMDSQQGLIEFLQGWSPLGDHPGDPAEVTLRWS